MTNPAKRRPTLFHLLQTKASPEITSLTISLLLATLPEASISNRRFGQHAQPTHLSDQAPVETTVDLSA